MCASVLGKRRLAHLWPAYIPADTPPDVTAQLQCAPEAFAINPGLQTDPMAQIYSSQKFLSHIRRLVAANHLRVHSVFRT